MWIHKKLYIAEIGLPNAVVTKLNAGVTNKVDKRLSYNQI